MTPSGSRNSRPDLASVLRAGLVRAGLGTMVMRITGLALTLGTSVLLARVLGPDGLGAYALAFAAISLLGLPVQMGLPSLVLRETAQSQAVQDWPRLRGMWFWATRRVLVLSVVILVLSGLAVLLLPDLIPEMARPVFIVGLPLIPLVALSHIRSAAMKGLGRIVWGQLPDMLIRPGLLVILVGGAFLLLGRTLAPDQVMGLHLTAAAVAFGIGVLLLLRARPEPLLLSRVRDVRAKDWNSAIWPLAMIAGAQSITANADFMMLGWWQPVAEVGMYKVATSGAALTATGLGIVAIITEPRFAALYKTGKSRELARLAAISAAMGFVAAIPALFVFSFWGKEILTLVFGAQYAEGAPALVILTVGQALSAFFGSCVGLLNMTGHERHAMRGFLIATLVNLVLNFVLIPRFGIAGAAMATLISTVVWNMLLWLSVRRLLAVDSSVLGLWSWRRA